MNPLKEGGRRSYNFLLSKGDYGKQIVKSIEAELPRSSPYKQQLIWTVQRFNFGTTKYSSIILNVMEYGSALTFRTQDEGITFELTIPELATDAPPRKKWLGIF